MSADQFNDSHFIATVMVVVILKMWEYTKAYGGVSEKYV